MANYNSESIAKQRVIRSELNVFREADWAMQKCISLVLCTKLNIQGNECSLIYKQMTPLNESAWSAKPVLSRWSIFVAITKNTLCGSKLLIF